MKILKKLSISILTLLLGFAPIMYVSADTGTTCNNDVEVLRQFYFLEAERVNLSNGTYSLAYQTAKNGIVTTTYSAMYSSTTLPGYKSIKNITPEAVGKDFMTMWVAAELKKAGQAIPTYIETAADEYIKSLNLSNVTSFQQAYELTQLATNWGYSNGTWEKPVNGITEQFIAAAKTDIANNETGTNGGALQTIINDMSKALILPASGTSARTADDFNKAPGANTTITNVAVTEQAIGKALTLDITRKYADVTTSGVTPYKHTFTGMNGDYWVFIPAKASATVTSTTCKYTLTYDANGGENAPASQTEYTSNDLEISASTPTKNGYVFKGWASTKDTTSVEYNPGDIYTDRVDKTIYAVWEKEGTTSNPKTGIISTIAITGIIAAAGCVYLVARRKNKFSNL